MIEYVCLVVVAITLAGMLITFRQMWHETRTMQYETEQKRFEDIVREAGLTSQEDEDATN